MSFFFQGMPGMGGFPGMHGGGGGGDDEDNGQSQSSNNERYYETLGLKKGASMDEIKQAYRKLARQYHPDRHPNEKETYHQKFTELQEAYEVLSDPEKKKLYDRYGEAGLKGGGGANGMGDIFDMFFGGSRARGGRGSQRQQKAPPVNVFLDITLEDCYIGTSKKIKYDQMVLCRECEGKGGKKVTECTTCNGTGTQVIMQRMGHITMQTQKECSKCEGQGTMIRDADKCKKCNGKGMSKVSKEIDVSLQRGCKNADKIVLRGQGHEVASAANGDVVVVLRVAKHDLFQRIGADLAMTQHITLKEAICGYDIKIPHLSGSILRLKAKKGEIVQPSQLKAVHEKGMPQKGSNIFGNLYVKIEIDFPKTGDLTGEALETISQLLPENKEDKDDKEEKKESKQEKQNKKNKKNEKDEKSKMNVEEKPDEKPKSNADEKAETNADEKSKMNVDENGNTNTNGTTNADANEDDEEQEKEFDINEEAEDVVGEPTVTPASSKSACDEDEEQEGTSCRQM